MQLQSSTQSRELQYKNSFDCFRRVYKEEGFRGFYKGLSASYVGKPLSLPGSPLKCSILNHANLFTSGISESSLQMVLYEYLRSVVQKYSCDIEDKAFTDSENWRESMYHFGIALHTDSKSVYSFDLLF
jgi:hypothetical protein